MGIPVALREVAAGLMNGRTREQEGRPGARGAGGFPALCHPERGDSASEAASSFPKASALLPSLEARQGGSCRPCVISRQERPPRQGKDPGKALRSQPSPSPSSEEAEVGSGAMLEPPLRQSGKRGFLLTSCVHSPLLRVHWAFLGSLREEEGNFLHASLLTIRKKASPTWGEGALQGTQTQVLILQALWEPLSIPLLPVG